MSMDRPREADTHIGKAAADDDAKRRLAALSEHLKAHGFEVELTSAGLLVINPDVPACCGPPGKRASDTITCRPYAEDGYRLWFFSSWQQPIADAYRVTDSVVQIKGYLSPGSKVIG